MDKIKEDKDVYMLDRKNRSVTLVNEMCVCDALEVLEKDTEYGRFEFWYEEVSEDAEL